MVSVGRVWERYSPQYRLRSPEGAVRGQLGLHSFDGVTVAGSRLRRWHTDMAGCYLGTQFPSLRPP